MTIPENIECIKGEIADYWYGKDGILYSFSKSPKRTIQNITDNVALVKKITGGKKVPLLIYLSNSPVPDKATQAFARQQLAEVYKAVAMISETGLSKLIMNALFKFNPPPVPIKSFSDEKEAKKWLKQYIRR